MDVERDAGFDYARSGRLSNGDAWRGEQGSRRALRSSSDSETGKGDELDSLILTVKERIRHFTWTWFTMTMATGGIANVIATVPLRFHGLYAIGCIFFIFNLVLFLFDVVMIGLRFRLYPSTFKASLLHPTESLFVPASVISLGTVLINICQYGLAGDKTGYWLNTTMVVFFWIYCALSVIFSCGIYLLMWSTQTFTISQMTPVWIFPAYPLLVAGPFAGNLCRYVSGNTSLQIIVGGFIMQGIGFMVSLMIYAAYLYRLMTQKLPQESLRPGMFISVGPSGFTISGLINMAAQLPRVVPPAFMGENGQLAGQVSMIMADWAGLWLWGLALWFFFVSVGAHYSSFSQRKMHFAMTWYSFIFPNTALITATFAVSSPSALNNKAIQIIGCVMTCLLIFVWFLVFGGMIRAVWLKHILWPQKQEDRDEGGWKSDKKGTDSMRRHAEHFDRHQSKEDLRGVDNRKRKRWPAKKDEQADNDREHAGRKPQGQGSWSSDSGRPMDVNGDEKQSVRHAQQRDTTRTLAEGSPTQLDEEPEHETADSNSRIWPQNAEYSLTTHGNRSSQEESGDSNVRPRWDVPGVGVHGGRPGRSRAMMPDGLSMQQSNGPTGRSDWDVPGVGVHGGQPGRSRATMPDGINVQQSDGPTGRSGWNVPDVGVHGGQPGRSSTTMPDGVAARSTA